MSWARILARNTKHILKQTKFLLLISCHKGNIKKIISCCTINLSWGCTGTNWVHTPDIFRYSYLSWLAMYDFLTTVLLTIRVFWDMNLSRGLSGFRRFDVSTWKATIYLDCLILKKRRQYLLRNLTNRSTPTQRTSQKNQILNPLLLY
jgi:hypothetical protein